MCSSPPRTGANHPRTCFSRSGTCIGRPSTSRSRRRAFNTAPPVGRRGPSRGV
jgi:hypothetical protein